jgi:PAS domain S-box-containing protein
MPVAELLGDDQIEGGADRLLARVAEHPLRRGVQYAGRMLAVPGLRADGSRISIEFTVTLLQDPSGAVRGIGAILRDVTARWEQQRTLQRELQELKRRVADSDG